MMSCFKDFGESLPATGFGINVDQLASGLLKGNEPKQTNASTKQSESNIRIALTKGRLEKSIVDLFEEMEYDCSSLKDKGRKLLQDNPK